MSPAKERVDAVLGLIAADRDNDDLDAWEIYSLAKRLIIALAREAGHGASEELAYLAKLMVPVDPGMRRDQ